MAPRSRHTVATRIRPKLAVMASLLCAATSYAGGDDRPADARLDDANLQPPAGTVFLAIGDSLTQGTMDATDNKPNTEHAYVQLVADSLADALPIVFSQPFFDLDGKRLRPRQVPTNLGVDGANVFSIEGFEYGPRTGAEFSFLNDDYVCNAWLPLAFDSRTDRVLYPINREARQDVTVVDAAVWHLQQVAALPQPNRAIVLVWIGNNDTSAAALGGGSHPSSQPIPADLAAPELSRGLNRLIDYGFRQGEIDFEPYTEAAIERNMTTLDDFAAQYAHVLSRLETESGLDPTRYDVFLATLPYYSSIGYLMDSEDLEFYLRQIDPTYTVPPTFARVAPQGEPIVDPLAGDRVSLLTFGVMYLLLDSGYSPDYVNQALEVNGAQRDGLVLSESEQALIRARIDGFNDVIVSAAAARPDFAHLIDAGGLLNDVLTGRTEVVVGGRKLSRKWVRGGGFSLDGVHPDYTGHALIANYILEQIDRALGIATQPVDVEAVAQGDPYIDRDGDGWAPGPDYHASGMTELLLLLTDADDTDPSVGPNIPRNIWRLFSRAMIHDMVGRLPGLRLEAERLGLLR